MSSSVARQPLATVLTQARERVTQRRARSSGTPPPSRWRPPPPRHRRLWRPATGQAAEASRQDQESHLVLEVPSIDAGVAYPARVYNYLLGGHHNFAADREAAERAGSSFPGGTAGARSNARANRLFLQRAVRYLVGEAGVRQLLDIGTGIPRGDNVHQVAQAIAPDCRVVYVDNDPVVLAHAHNLGTGVPDAATAFIYGDARHPDPILEAAATTLDFNQPTAVILTGILHFVSDDQDPYGIVAKVVDATCSGSYLAISHLVSDVRPDEMARMAEQFTKRMHTPMVPRSRAEVSRFFDGLELVDPGLVPVTEWRPDAGDRESDHISVIDGAVGRKPGAA